MEKEEMKKEKSKNSIIIVLVIIVCVLMMVVGFFLGKNSAVENNDNDDVVEKNDIETEDDIEDNQDVVEEIKDLDLSKSLNTTGITYSNADDTESKYGLSMNINSDKKSITLSIDWEKFGPLSTASQWANVVEDYQVIGFSKEVINTFVGELGQDPTGITLFFLMSDGTVEYMPVFANSEAMNYTLDYSSDGKITGQHFETKGAVDGVSDVIKLYNVSFSNGQTGAMTTIGAKKDGSFYDLGTIIN